MRAAGTVVTTSRFGGESTGDSSAEIAFASRREQWKNRGSASARFSGAAAVVELREGDKEVRERSALAAKESRHAGQEVAVRVRQHDGECRMGL